MWWEKLHLHLTTVALPEIHLNKPTTKALQYQNPSCDYRHRCVCVRVCVCMRVCVCISTASEINKKSTLKDVEVTPCQQCHQIEQMHITAETTK